MRRPALLSTLSIAALAAQSLGWASPTLAAATPVTVPFAYTGDQQIWQVPAGVSTVHIVLVGARGGESGGPNASGGFGARVEGDIPVTAGSPLYVEVGGVGLPGNTAGGGAGFNGGGQGGTGSLSGWGGGGASDVRPIPLGSPGSAFSAIVVAAGGGGAGNSTGGTPGAALGGNAGSAGANGTGASGGAAGGQGVGGAGGTGSTAAMKGGDGTEATGGDGGDDGTGTTGYGGGGGGGGYYGGGGGGGSTQGRGAGGGGGSSWTDRVTNLSLTTDTTAVPSVTITYTPPADNGTVHAQFSVPTSAACLALSTSSIDFGSVHLGSENIAATPDVTVTSCSGSSEDLFAHGSDATATGTTWSLVGGSATCSDTLGTDQYRLQLESTAGTVGLSTTNASVGSLAAGDTSTQTARIFAACPGSSGAGQLMTSQITFLAVEGG